MNKKQGFFLLAGVFMGIVIYGILIILLFNAEKGVEGAGIQNIHDAIWYSVVTLTTVGYGDFYPVSLMGKIIGYIFVISSLGVLGFLIGKINSVVTEIRRAKHLGYRGINFKNHIVIIGYNDFAGGIIQELVNAKIKVAIVTDKIDDLELVKEKFDKSLVYVLLSDLNNFQLIEKTNINSSGSVFINIKNDTEKLVYFINASKYFDDSLDYVVTSQNPELDGVFRDAGIRYVLSIEEFASKIIASYIFEPAVADYFEDLLASAVDEDDYDIKEYMVNSGNPYVNQTYNSVFFKVKEEFDAVLIGIVKFDKDGHRELIKNPNNETLKVELGDFLILITNGSTAEKISNAFNITEGSLIPGEEGFLI